MIVVVVARKAIDLLIQSDVTPKFLENRPLFESTKIASELLIAVKTFVLSILLFLSLILLDILSVSTMTSVIGGGGIAGIIFASLLGILANTLIIYRYRLARKGDMIDDLENGIRGTVVDISLLYTTLLTADYEKIRILNYRIRSDDIVNHMRQSRSRRIKLDILVTYDSDIDEVRDVVLNAMSGSDSILKPDEMNDSDFESGTTLDSDEPAVSWGSRGLTIPLAPQVKVDELEDSGIQFRAYFWIREPCKLRAVKSELKENILREFNKGDLEIAYPHNEVLFKDGSNAVEVEFGLFD